MVESERVRLFKRIFMALHNEGYSIPEIADKCNISRQHAYFLLEEIAQANGVTRDSLLMQVHKKRETQTQNNNPRISTVSINPNDLANDFAQLLADTDKIIATIETMIGGENHHE